jgi:hypothetical protein
MNSYQMVLHRPVETAYLFRLRMPNMEVQGTGEGFPLQINAAQLARLRLKDLIVGDDLHAQFRTTQFRILPAGLVPRLYANKDSQIGCIRYIRGLL